MGADPTLLANGERVCLIASLFCSVLFSISLCLSLDVLPWNILMSMGWRTAKLLQAEEREKIIRVEDALCPLLGVCSESR